MEIRAEELINLGGLIEKKLASIEVSGQLHESGLDERILHVKRATFCQYSGQRGGDCEYTLTFEQLRNIRGTCEGQIVALTEQLGALKSTIEAIDGLLPQEGQAEGQSRKKKASR